MNQTRFDITRRQALSGLGATSALALTGCATAGRTGSVTQAQSVGVERLLEIVGYNLLEHEPERATSLGVDTGRHYDLRSKLENQSIAGRKPMPQPFAETSIWCGPFRGTGSTAKI